MQNNQNNFSIKNLVEKYRKYAIEHCPKSWESDGKEEILLPIDEYAFGDEQLIATLYKKIEGENANNRILSALSLHLDNFYSEALSNEEISFLCDNFSDVIWYEFYHRYEWYNATVREFVSSERIQLISEYAKLPKGANIFIADTEFGDVAMLFPYCTIYGFTGMKYSSEEVWALGQIRLFAAGVKSEIVPGKVINDNYIYTLPEKGSMDMVIFRANANKYAQQLFGTECTDINALYDILKPGGKMLFFSDEKDELAGRDAENPILSFRDRIVNNKEISSIIEYEDTSILGYRKEAQILLIVEKKYNKEVVFKIENSNEMFSIDSEKICKDILWPSFYKTRRPEKGIPLSNLVSHITVELRNHELIRENGRFIIPEEMKRKFVVTPSKMAKDYKDANLITQDLGYFENIEESGEQYLMRSIKEPYTLLYCKKNNFVVGYIDSIPEEGIVSPLGIIRLLPKAGIDVRYVAAILLLPEVKEQIISIWQGNVDSYSFSLIMDKIIVPNHTEKERLAFLSETNYTALLSSKKEMSQQHKNYVKSVRMRKHALTQSLSSIEAMFYALNEFRIHQKGNLSDEKVISRVKGTTVKEAFEFLSNGIKEMMPVLDHIADVEYSFSKPESIDPEDFIENYINREEKGWLNFKPVITWQKGSNKAKHNDSGIAKGDSLSTFKFSKEALERVFNNILSNVKSYAFTDDTRKDYILKFSWFTDGLSLVIMIENNGTPIPEDRETASLLEYGVSTALHHDGHNGIGCSEIVDIMSRYDGSMKLVSKPNEDFTVKYILSFNNTFTYTPIKNGIQ